MRIEAYTQVQQLYGTRKAGRAYGATAVSRPRDAVEISSLGQNLQAVKKAVNDAPDVREELTAPLKAAINAGTYQVSGGSFADRLMEKLGM